MSKFTCTPNEAIEVSNILSQLKVVVENAHLSSAEKRAIADLAGLVEKGVTESLSQGMKALRTREERVRDLKEAAKSRDRFSQYGEKDSPIFRIEKSDLHFDEAIEAILPHIHYTVKEWSLWFSVGPMDAEKTLVYTFSKDENRKWTSNPVEEGIEKIRALADDESIVLHYSNKV